MCLCFDVDMPSVFRREERVARKARRCCECGRHIPVGVRYEYVFGVWDGDPGVFATCARCVVLRAAHEAAEDDPECHVAFGELVATIGECVREEPTYLAAFRAARRTLEGRAA